jgi:hypothetical protein
MLKALHILPITILLLCISIPASAIEWDDSKFMALDDIQPGMRGKIRTVFSGTEVEEFNMEVISIERNYAPQWDVIWARCWGGTFDETGVAGGMSGSPTYINGRLIGAVSLGAYNQKKGDILGITPIESMIRVTQRGMTPNPSYSSSGGGEFASLWAASPSAMDAEGDGSDPDDWDSLIAPLRLEMPVAISGFDPGVMQYIQPLLKKYGMYPVQGAGGGSVDVDVPIEPGQILGMEFARGDITMFGYGTITYIEGNQILAFGHSMFQEGNVNLPVSTGYVHYVLPQTTRSSKMASPVRPIGTLVQDRQCGIAGILGPHPRYIPITVRIQTADGIARELHYEVIRHRDFTAAMAAAGARMLVDAVDRSSGDYTAKLHTVIALKDNPDIVRDDFYSGRGPGSAAYQSLSPLLSLIGNPYSEVEIESISIDISIEDERHIARIEGAHIDKGCYKPGDEVQIWITLHPYLEEPIVQRTSITIPKDTPDGIFALMVSSVSDNESWQRKRAPLNFQPTDIQQLIRILQRGDNSDHVIIELYGFKRGITVRGQELPELPISMMYVMTMPHQTGESGFTSGTTVLQEKLPTPYVISGSSILRLVIDRNAP